MKTVQLRIEECSNQLQNDENPAANILWTSILNVLHRGPAFATPNTW